MTIKVSDCPQHPDGPKLIVYQDKGFLGGIESQTFGRIVTGYECYDCGRELLGKRVDDQPP